MRYNKIPKTGLSVSAVSLGTWVFGGDNWSGSDENTAIRTVRGALDSGINLIDTAPVYGWGLSEKIVGKAVKGSRDKIVIATKCGLIKAGKSIKISLKPESVRKELSDSLKRLGTDYIDIYQLHWPDKDTPLEETLGELQKAVGEGKIRCIGVSNFNLDLLKKAASICRIATIQNEYSFLKRDTEKDILPWCLREGTGFLAYGPLGGGILTGKYKTETKFPAMDARSFFYKFYSGKNFKRADKAAGIFRRLGEAHKKPASQLAINWVAGRQGVTSAIAGARTPEQAQSNAQSADLILREKEIELLTAINI